MLEEILIQIFYRAAAHHGDRYPPKYQDVEEVVKHLAAVMRDMNLCVIPANLLPEPKQKRNKKND